jgi:hypothetical protein
MLLFFCKTAIIKLDKINLRPSSGSHEQQPQAQQKMNPAWVNFEEPRHSVLIFKEQMVYKELMTKFQKLDPANLMQNKNDYQIFQLVSYLRQCT